MCRRSNALIGQQAGGAAVLCVIVSLAVRVTHFLDPKLLTTISLFQLPPGILRKIVKVLKQLTPALLDKAESKVSVFPLFQIWEPSCQL